MANYHRGRRREWKIRDQLRKDGYTVIRAAGSKGPHDLVAILPSGPLGPEVRLIQVKSKGSNGLTIWPQRAKVTTELWVVS